MTDPRISFGHGAEEIINQIQQPELAFVFTQPNRNKSSQLSATTTKEIAQESNESTQIHLQKQRQSPPDAPVQSLKIASKVFSDRNQTAKRIYNNRFEQRKFRPFSKKMRIVPSEKSSVMPRECS